MQGKEPGQLGALCVLLVCWLGLPADRQAGRHANHKRRRPSGAQVALHHHSHMLPGLLGRRSAAAALAALGHLTQFLQDASEEVLVLLW